MAPDTQLRIFHPESGCPQTFFLGTRISEQAVQASWNVAATASPTASLACVPAWHEELPKWRGSHLVIERL